MNKRDIIEEYCSHDSLFADGYDDAILGIDDATGRIVYSVSQCIDILSREMSYSEATEFFYFNVAGAYMGKMTPIWVDDNAFVEDFSDLNLDDIIKDE